LKVIKRLLCFVIILGAAVSICRPGRQSLSVRASSATRPRVIIVLVLDGLRPDSINREDTPNLYRLRAEGVNYVNAHSVFPTVTRVNAAALSTGYYPTVNGLVSNSMYVPGVDTVKPFTTADAQQLLKMKDVSQGRLLFAKTLGERLQERGMRLAVVCSGSTGLLSLLLNPEAPQGVGVLVSGYFESGKVVAYPAEVSKQILSRFGPAPSQDPPHENLNAAVDWAEQLLRDYVLPDLKPDVLIDWMSEPDDTQHPKGVNSPEALIALRNCDRNMGLLLRKLEALGIADKTDLIVISDHGFAQHTKGVNVTQQLIKASLNQNGDSNDVVVVSNAQAVLLHVKNHNAEQIKRIVEYLQKQDWTDVIFAHERNPSIKESSTNRRQVSNAQLANPYGWVGGTFSLELIHEANPERGPDIVFTLPWSSAVNPYGVRGTSYGTSNGTGDQITGDPHGHGGLSPWAVNTTMIAWGVDFRRGVTVRVSSSNVDVAPTILSLERIAGCNDLDGRVLAEALQDGPDPEQMPYETSMVSTSAGEKYRAILQLSIVGRRRYVVRAGALGRRISKGPLGDRAAAA
jgi:arylsulfatase A-like enzyme